MPSYATGVLLQRWTPAVRAGAAMDTVPAYPTSRPDIRLPCPADEAATIQQEVLAAFSDHPIDTLDGVRIAFPHGWALVRTSVTEPLLTLRFEAHTEGDLRDIQSRVRRASPLLQALWPLD
jgi:phosphomannomutase/phosphoglucomutase